MSTQLILYPQTYNGQYTSNATSVFNQYIVNGINFTGLDNTLLHNTTSIQPSQDAIDDAPPTVLGNWYRFTTTGGDWGAVTAPALAIGSIQLSVNVAAPGRTGVYQKLSGLSVGGVYGIKILIVTPQVGTLAIEMYSGTVLNSQQSFSTNTTLISTTFTAQTSNDIFLIDYTNTAGTGAAIFIQNIFIQESATTPSLIFSELEDGQVICDLYQEEDIPLSLSIDDFKNVAEKVQSYSKDFNLPATKRNNQIFNNMFEVTRADDGLIFNPYIKTKCVLKQDGFILFEGYLRLIDVKDKEGEISYNVNLYSEVVALADVLKDKTFSDLDFSELEHDYNKGPIKNSWYDSVGLPLNNYDAANPLPTSSFAYDASLNNPENHTSVLKYPFIDWNHQFVVGGTGGHPSATIGRPELTTLEEAFRPCIQLKYLINKIFAASGFNWTSNFLETTIAGGGDFDFDKLFMDFNWGGDANPNSVNETGLGWYQVDQPDHIAIASFTPIELNFNNYDAEFGYDDATNIFTCPVGQGNSTYDFGYSCQVRCYSATTQYADLEMQWLHTEALTSNTNVIDFSAVTMETSASTDVLISFGGISSVTVIDPGYYPLGTPTATLQGTGSPYATITVVMAGTGVASVTITGAGTGWSAWDTILVFNAVDPLHTYSGNCSVLLQENDTLQLQFKSTVATAIRQNNVIVYDGSTPSTTLVGNIGMIGVTNATILNTLRGELGQWDFLKGIMTMFNLITMVDENNPNNILIEPYAEVFIKNTNSLTATTPTNNSLAARSIEHDWTDKVDVSEMELKPLTDLNKNTIFKFVEDDDDYAFQVYKESTSGHLYGSKEWDASSFTILEGIKEIIAEPFAATVSKPLMSQFSTFVTPALYSMSDDGTSEGFDNSPRIFYNNGRISTGTTFFICTQNGVTGENQSHFLQFSHLTTIPTISNVTKDFLFQSQQLLDPIATFSGAPVNNLFSVYWQPYFDELYSPDTRTMTLKVNLSPADVASFKFYDTVFIKNRVFRVNKIDYKPNDLATVEFILIP
jgi:hypothetical protein